MADAAKYQSVPDDLEATHSEPSLVNAKELPANLSQRGPHQYATGEVIADKYRLISMLGQGSMGTVWRAHNDVLDVRVAVKLIRAGAGSVENTGRLLTEARAAACLQDPAIVRVFDFGETMWGDPYIVMELLDGENLEQTISRKGCLSPIKAVRALLPIAKALSSAHARGIVHRDLKPENIFLCQSSEGTVRPKLLDFGIAKFDSALALRLTTTGSLMGSPLYMSPEQARGVEADHRADIWSLCVVLYESMVGTPPFAGDNYHAVLHRITSEDPDPTPICDVADVALWEIIDKGLCKDPDGRWNSVRDLGKALAQWLSARGVNEDITGVSVHSNWIEDKARLTLLTSLPPVASSPGEYLRVPEIPGVSSALQASIDALGGVAVPTIRIWQQWLQYCRRVWSGKVIPAWNARSPGQRRGAIALCAMAVGVGAAALALREPELDSADLYASAGDHFTHPDDVYPHQNLRHAVLVGVTSNVLQQSLSTPVSSASNSTAARGTNGLKTERPAGAAPTNLSKRKARRRAQLKNPFE